MKLAKKVFTIVFILLFIVLVVVLIKVNIDINKSNEYILYVTNSANEISSKVEEINGTLNDFEYSESGENVSELETSLTEIGNVYDNITNDKVNYTVPYKGEVINESFGNYLEGTEGIITSYNEIIVTMNNLEDRDVFDEKVEDYIVYSNDLQNNLETLEQDLNEYVQEYNKLDFDRIIHGFKSI